MTQRINQFIHPSIHPSNKEDRKHKDRGVHCNGLREVEVASADEVVSILRQADETRRTEATKMNDASSRSHCLFTITVTAREVRKQRRYFECSHFVLYHHHGRYCSLLRLWLFALLFVRAAYDR